MNAREKLYILAIGLDRDRRGLLDTIITFERLIEVYCLAPEMHTPWHVVVGKNTRSANLPAIIDALSPEVPFFAQALAISTYNASNLYVDERGKPIDNLFRTSATRIDYAQFRKGVIAPDPQREIKDFPGFVMRGESRKLEDAVAHHRAVVEGVLEKFKDSVPRIFHDGRYLLEKRADAHLYAGNKPINYALNSPRL